METRGKRGNLQFSHFLLIFIKKICSPADGKKISLLKSFHTPRVTNTIFIFLILSRSKGVGSLKKLLASMFVKYPLLLHLIFSQISTISRTFLDFSSFFFILFRTYFVCQTHESKNNKEDVFSYCFFFVYTKFFNDNTPTHKIKIRFELLSIFSLFSIVSSH